MIEIKQKLARRAVEIMRQNYPAADAIRADLAETSQVELYDKKDAAGNKTTWWKKIGKHGQLQQLAWPWKEECAAIVKFADLAAKRPATYYQFWYVCVEKQADPREQARLEFFRALSGEKSSKHTVLECIEEPYVSEPCPICGPNRDCCQGDDEEVLRIDGISIREGKFIWCGASYLAFIPLEAL